MKFINDNNIRLIKHHNRGHYGADRGFVLALNRHQSLDLLQACLLNFSPIYTLCFHVPALEWRGSSPLPTWYLQLKHFYLSYRLVLHQLQLGLHIRFGIRILPNFCSCQVWRAVVGVAVGLAAIISIVVVIILTAVATVVEVFVVAVAVILIKIVHPLMQIELILILFQLPLIFLLFRLLSYLFFLIAQ